MGELTIFTLNKKNPEELSSFQVAHVSKFSENSGLGISLEATVGHHFIRSVLPEGPVGHSRKLFSGDELLEVRRSDFY